MLPPGKTPVTLDEVFGDPLSVDKAQKKVVEFLVRDVTSEQRRALPLGWDEGMEPEDIERLGLSFTDDDKSWSVQKILDTLATEVERHPDPRSEGRMNAVNVALDRVVRANPTMGPLEEGMVLKFIANQQTGVLSLTDLKKQLLTLRRGDITGETHAELAEACIQFLKKYGEFRYDASKFWQWHGAAWVQRNEGELLKLIAENYGQYPAGKRQGDHSGILKVMKALAAAPLRNSYVKGINFANGYLTEQLELVAHHPDYGMTYTLPYRYTPEKAGHMPIFDQFLNDSWATDADYGDKLLALQEAIGVSLFGKGPAYQMAFLLFGQAGAGKSVMQAIMKGLVPYGSSASIPPTDWGDKFLPAELFGKVINFAGELSESKPIPGDVFKKIISGEDMTVQYKNGQPFSFEPEAAHWFNSNFLPRTRDSSDGFNRRWLILEFNNRIDPSKRVNDLDAQILEHEREAIVAWAIQGYRRLMDTNKYTLPTSHLALVESMAADNNTVRHFLTSPGTVLKWGAEHKIAMADLHTHYWQFMLATGSSHRANVPKFTKLMKELSGSLPFQIEVQGANELYYLGVGV